jgi:outer membrane protein assembly factor BamB
VRSLHDPFGNGANVIFAGGSDTPGVDAAATALVEKLEKAGAKPGLLSVGWLMDIKLGKGITVPKNLKDFEIWEAGASYRSVGYFGWNSISKRMAMYYMTGDPFQAREVVRLAFPDKQVLKEITEIDEERIENKDDPLAGPYHYNAHMTILFWDLIEESPVFTDEERLRITNAFARQLNHRKDEGIYPLTGPVSAVGSRHGQWAAISLYCLGRYFQKYYPNPIWGQCAKAGVFAFGSLHKHTWVAGENDNLFWYNTAIAPILTYMVLTGDRKPLENGGLQTLLRGQEVLASGRQPDWALTSAALDFLHKAAYLTQDGRWLTYRNRTGIDTSVFRLGQSFWPEDHLEPVPPDDLVGKWSIYRLPKLMWQARQSGLPFEDSLLFGSFRSAADASGDFILIDGFNGASRNPYHCFAILELRLAGNTILQGYNNQVLVKADGMVEPKVAMDAALRYSDVVGETAVAVADCPKMAFCNWRRVLAQRIGRYALVVDDLTFRTDSDNIEVQTKWEANGSFRADAKDNVLQLQLGQAPALPPGWRSVRACDAECTSNLTGEKDLIKLDSLGIMLLRATSPGAWIEMPFVLKERVSGEVFADVVNFEDRGTIRISLDGKVIRDSYDHYTTAAIASKVPLGKLELTPGEHRLRVEVIGKRPEIEKCYVGFGGLSIRPEGAPDAASPTVFEVRGCDPVKVTGGHVAITEWLGPAKKDQHRIFFSLIGSQQAGGDSLKCVRIAENAAALALPAPGLAVTGEFEGVKADVAIVADDHIYAKDATQVTLDGTLLAADTPVNADWNFKSGALHVVAGKDTSLRVWLAPADGLQVDDKAMKAERAADGLTILTLSAGKHVITGARPDETAQRKMSARLAALLAKGNEDRARLLVSIGKEEKPTAPPLAAAMTANVGGNVVQLIIIPSASGPLLCAAEGKTVHVLSPDGKEVRRLQADGNIRVLHWWSEPRLLLAGCVDEKVIAFDESGARKWVFTSEMDPAVFRAAKQYWFKTAPGHEGIHGLYSGVFLDGKSQAFVGSACTLEIIDAEGKLVKRMPVFWGCGAKFALIDAPDGGRNLLIARQPTDGHALAIMNSRKPEAVLRGFETVPEGHTYVGGWACMSRKHIFYEDLDGDGKKEIASEINGTWNRVTVWSAEGKPLYNAQFGPGLPIPTQNMRDLDMADINGDGKKEIITATSAGLVVALDHTCQKIWAKRLPSPPTVLKCVVPPGSKTPWIVVGCEDGNVIVLDGKGQIIHMDKVTGRPTCIESLAPPAIALATDKGEVKLFKVAE